MPDFIHNDFLLGTQTARRLYHEHAAGLPIIDYHSHVATADIAADRAYTNLTELWIAPDQYKHRAMRAVGVAEHFITGGADPHETFLQWAATVPRTLGHPLYHWTAVELKTYFGIVEPLNPDSALRIWEACNEQLSEPSHRARGLLKRTNVECVCSSDRFLDDLAAHHALADTPGAPRVRPSLRADDLLAIEATTFPQFARDLGFAAKVSVDDLAGLITAMERRLDVFAAHGCRLSDHGIDHFDYRQVSQATTATLYARRVAGETLTSADAAQLRSGLLFTLGTAYARRGWTMQLHLGAQRQTSTRLRTIAGPAGGYATIGGTTEIARLCQFLDDLECTGALPRTILYTLNPADNAAFATLTGSFTQEGVEGKIQFGPAWWFNDHALGIRQHLETLAHHGLLSTFVGMTTDSRSLLSLSRHDYFRRVLCDYIGEQVEHGRFPTDDALLADLVRRIGYENARSFLFPSSS